MGGGRVAFVTGEFQGNTCAYPGEAGTNRLTQKITVLAGITGQDGSYLAELLLGKGYQVHGLMRRASTFNTERIAHLLDNPGLKLHYGDLTDLSSMQTILKQIKAEEPSVLEVYNLAAQSHVQVSFDSPLYTAQVDAIGTLNLLEAIRVLGFPRGVVKFCQASTSEMFGSTPPPQSEETPFHPRSPYAVSKVFAYWAVKNYREAYGMFACNTICFNHESERRGETFVTRKIAIGVGRIAKGDKAPIQLGNLDALRDWGHAEDYVRAMWTVLQQEQPDDFVVATNEQHSVREFAELAFAEAGMPIVWEGDVGKRVDSGEVVVSTSADYLRPAEVDSLLGDPAKLRAKTGWQPSVSFPQLVKRMVQSELSKP